MNALDIVAKHIGEVAQRLTEKFGAELKSLRQETEQRFKLEEQARGLAERKQELELSEVRKGLGSIEAFSKALVDERETVKAAIVEMTKGLVEQRVKEIESELGRKHEAELEAVQKSLGEQIEGLSNALTKAAEDRAAERKSLEDAVSALKATLAEKDERVAAVEKSLTEPIESATRAGSVIKRLAESLEATKAPDEGLAEGLAEIRAKLAEVEKQLGECMRPAGQWDEGREYQKGETVAHKNALWIAERPTDRMPGSSDSGWKMYIKASKLLTGYEHR